LNAAPAGKYLVRVEVGLDQSDDCRNAVAVQGGEEGAASLWQQELFQGEGAIDGFAFVFCP
jgi:hypothetical protein